MRKSRKLSVEMKRKAVIFVGVLSVPVQTVEGKDGKDAARSGV